MGIVLPEESDTSVVGLPLDYTTPYGLLTLSSIQVSNSSSSRRSPSGPYHLRVLGGRHERKGGPVTGVLRKGRDDETKRTVESPRGPRTVGGDEGCKSESRVLSTDVLSEDRGPS